MGGEKGMGNKDNKIILYSSQAENVVKKLKEDGVCFSKKDYVIKKYEESAPIFVAAYSWFVLEMEKYVSKPMGAEYPYWAFKDLYSVEGSGNSEILRLNVPIDEAVFFDMYDFNKILRLQYIGETNEDEEEFRKIVKNYGIRHESEVVLTNFYPELKSKVLQSWKRLFRHNESIKNGDFSNIGSIQVGLWQLKKEWII